MKTILEDITWLLPVRIDSINRLENILAVIKYLRSHLKINIMVLEASDGTNSFLKRLLPKDVKYIFYDDRDPVFYRTKYLNILISESRTKFVAIWDTDVLVPYLQIINSIDKLRIGEFDVALPYSGMCFDTSQILRRLFIKTNNINYLTKNVNKMNLLHGNNNLKGGGFFIDKEKYRYAGGENISFYGWGPEDFERYDRWCILEYKIFRDKGFMFHLSHPRNVNSNFINQYQKDNANAELFKTRNSSVYELRNHIEFE